MHLVHVLHPVSDGIERFKAKMTRMPNTFVRVHMSSQTTLELELLLAQGARERSILVIHFHVRTQICVLAHLLALNALHVHHLSSVDALLVAPNIRKELVALVALLPIARLLVKVYVRVEAAFVHEMLAADVASEAVRSPLVNGFHVMQQRLKFEY